MLCASCNQSLSSSAEVAKCAECSNQFHPACCRTRIAEKLKQLNARGGVWKCGSCSAKSESDNSNTLELLKNIQKQMAVDSKEFKTSFATLEKSMVSIQESMANIITRLSDIEQDNIRLREECSELRENNKQLNQRLWSAESKILVMEQYTRMSNLEVRGVPVTSDEDVYTILQYVANALQVPFNNEDISTAHRLQAPKNRNFHASIVVQFARRSVRRKRNSRRLIFTHHWCVGLYAIKLWLPILAGPDMSGSGPANPAQMAMDASELEKAVESIIDSNNLNNMESDHSYSITTTDNELKRKRDHTDDDHDTNSQSK
ncbi:hypothetical protein J6590_107930, partial [Homalodisca vitripennis]